MPFTFYNTCETLQLKMHRLVTNNRYIQPICSGGGLFVNDLRINEYGSFILRTRNIKIAVCNSEKKRLEHESPASKFTASSAC